MKILNIRLENFIGTDKIAKNNVVEIDFEKNKEYILLYGENGLGKTTILESLTPYPEMISRAIKDSIRYPARKTLEFQKGKDIIKIDISWEEGHTKGHIYINDIVTEETRKGNITEYKHQIEKMFGEYEKFKSSLFLKQGVQDIIQAKPKDRMNIINSFIQDLSIYDEIKEEVTLKEKEHKAKIDIIKDQINDMGSWEEEYKKYEKRVEEFSKIDVENIEETFKEIGVKKEIEDKKKHQLEVYENELKDIEENNNFTSRDVELKKEEIEKIKNDLIKKQSQYSLEELNNIINEINKIEKELEIKSKKDISTFDEQVIDLKDNSKDIIENMIEVNKRNTTINKQIVELKDKLSQIETQTEMSIEDLELEVHQKTKINEHFKRFDISKGVINYKNEERETILEQIEVNKRNTTINKQIVELKDKLSQIETQTEMSIEDLELEVSIKKDLLQIESEIKEFSNDKLEAFKELKDLNKELDKLSQIDGKTECDVCGHDLSPEETTKKVEEKSSRIQEIISTYGEVKNIDTEITILEETKYKNQYLNDKKNKLKAKTKLGLTIIEKEIKSKREVLNIEEQLKSLSSKLEEVICDDIKILEDTLFVKMLEEENIEYKIEDKIIFSFKTELKLKEMKEEIERKRTLKNIEEQLKLLSSKLEKVICDDIKILEDTLFVKMLEEENIEYIVDNEQLKYMISIESINEELIKRKETKRRISEVEKEIIKIKDEILKLEKELISIENYINKKEQIKEKINSIDFDKEKYLILEKDFNEVKSRVEEVKIEEQYLRNQKEHYEREITRYKGLVEQKEKEEEEYFTFNKLKNYSGRIKTALVSNFFANISDTVNELIKNDTGSLKDLKINIEQPQANKFNIIASNGVNEVKDISLLSGAEQSIVARGISLALAKKYNFGILWLDETDSALSISNKNSFIQTLDTAKGVINIEQFFLVSHNDNLKKEVDLVIDLNSMTNV